MKYVQGASVAAVWVVRCPLMPRALRLSSEYQERVHELIARRARQANQSLHMQR